MTYCRLIWPRYYHAYLFCILDKTHDKYTFVGHLVDDPVDEILENVEDEEEGTVREQSSGETKTENIAAEVHK